MHSAYGGQIALLLFNKSFPSQSSYHDSGPAEFSFETPPIIFAS